MGKKTKKQEFPEFRLPKRRQPIFKAFGTIISPFYRAKTESMIETLPDKAIIVSIHAAKKGPMAIAVSYPKFHAMWGHHSMLGNYVERFKYLRNVLYIQKMHKGRFIATFKATYEAAFSIWVYKGMKIIGTYTDMRLLSTIRNSETVLDANASIVVYPEDSSTGYYKELKSAFPGFVMLASAYYQKRGEDVPVIPAYISTDKKRFLIGEPRYVREMEKSGLNKQQIADVFKDDINALYQKYIATDSTVETTVKDAPIRTKAFYNED